MTEISYRVEIVPQTKELGGGYLAYFPTIGMLTINGLGDTQVEAVTRLMECAETVFAIWEEDGEKFPEPSAEDMACMGFVDDAADNNYAFAA